MSAVLIERSTADVLTLAQVKAQLRIDDDQTDEDDLLKLAMAAAVAECERKIGGPILTATYCETLGRWPSVPWVRLQTSGATSVTKIEVVHGGATDSWMEFTGLVDGPLLTVKPNSGDWPAVDSIPNAIKITYKAGLAAAPTGVPANVIQWMLYAAATFYTYRDRYFTGTEISELPGNFVDGLLDQYKLHEVAL